MAALCSGIALPSAFAMDSTTQPSVDQQLLNKIDSLQSQVNQLKAQVRHQQEQQDATSDAKVLQEIQDDATKHSQFMDSLGVTAGYANRRFFIQSDDGNFVLRPWVHVQIRYSTSIRDDFFPGWVKQYAKRI